jgi:hypothetical protein
MDVGAGEISVDVTDEFTTKEDDNKDNDEEDVWVDTVLLVFFVEICFLVVRLVLFCWLFKVLITSKLDERFVTMFGFEY